MSYFVEWCTTNKYNDHVFDFIEFPDLQQAEEYENTLKSFNDDSDDQWSLTWSIVDTQLTV